MPGIVGLVTKMPREQALVELSRMVGVIRHESFYTTGTWIDESSRVYVGWTALEGSFSDGMPLRNELGDAVLVFSGEEFPHPDTARRLKEDGHEFDHAGPSYLVHLSEQDPLFPAGLNGRFHGLSIDLKRRTAMLFNDRYGMHRVYYHESPDAFYFAAEAKAILAVRPELRRVDPRGLGEFASCGSVLENRTLFEGIQVLPPGSAWTFQNGVLERKNSYFHPKEWEDQETVDSESFYQQLREVFTANLPRYFKSEQAIGVSLTGGLDTRMIMAWHKGQAGSLPCYTFGGMLRECQDVTVARQVANACEQTHEVIRTGTEFLKQFPHYAQRAIFLTDGCVDVGRSPDVYLNEKVRQIAPVRMTGNYGGEVLRRVRAFKPEVAGSGLFSNDFLDHVRRTASTYSSIDNGHPVSFAVFKQCPWHHQGILALEQSQVSMRSPYLDNDFLKTLFRAPRSVLESNEISLRLIGDGSRKLLEIPTDRGLGGERSTLTGLASRFLHEVAFKAEYLSDMGMPQWAARADHVVSPLHLERLFLGRHKIFHFRVWYRDALAGRLREMLLDSRSLSRPYIDRKGVTAAVEGHLKGNRNYTTEIHKLLTLEIIHRLFVDGNGANPHNNEGLARPENWRQANLAGTT